jgi:hypothetical protein
MKPPTRRILAVVGAFLALIIVLLVLLPMLFGDRIASRAKAAVNQAVNARVDWRAAGLGLLRNFPNLTLRLDDLTVVGIGKFEGDTLAVVRQLRVVLDLASVLRNVVGGSSPVVVRGVELDRPRLSLVALEDGSANWDITKKTAPAPGARAGRPLAVSLRRFTIERGVVAFDNRAAKLRASLVGLNQTLSGDFSKEQVAVETRARVDTVTVKFGGITYLNHVRLDLTANAAADLAKKMFTLREGSGLRLNELPLALSGMVAKHGERLGLDLAFSAPKTDFKNILSLVPAVYAHDFQSVQTSGSLAVSGRVKGEYGKDAFPAFSLTAKVDNGSFRYPDLPLPARDIFLDLAVTNPGGAADSTVVNLSRLHLVLGRNPIDAGLVLRTPLSDPDVDLRVNGTVDLADLRRTIKLDKVQELSGSIAADAAIHTRKSWVDSARYDRVAARGTVNVKDLAVKAKALTRPLAIREATLGLAPQRQELRSFIGTVGSSDLQASGYLDNLLGYVMHDEDLRGSASLRSNRFNLDEWRSDTGSLNIIPVPPRLDFALDAKVGELLYGKLKMTNAQGRVRMKDQRATLENFTVNTLGGTVGVTGFYETTVPAKPTFDVGLRFGNVDIPSAFQTLLTVQLLAPVAKYARGTFSADLRANGALGKNMMPLLDQLTGQGALQTSQVTVQGFPPLEKVAALTKLDFLSNPTLQSLRSQFEIRVGRLQVKPFTVALGPTTATVSGSNGIDQTLDYDMKLNVPRALMGAEANQAIARLVSRAAGAGIDLQRATEIPLDIKITGKLTDPAIKVDIGSVAGSTAQAATQAVTEAARQKATAGAQQLVQEAESRANSIRAEARTLAETVKRQGYQQADALLARSSNPLERVAAGAAADRLRKEADDKSARIIREADARADSLVAEARKKASIPAP